MTYLQRYLDGEHEAVWRELVELGSAFREPEVIADAEAVAHETMLRVGENVQTLISRLKQQGYKFGSFQSGDWKRHRPYVHPSKNVRVKLSKIHRQFGSIPLSLTAFYEVVGAVNLVGHASWLSEIQTRPDALAVDSIDTALYSLQEWREMYEGEDEPDEPCALWIAPDEYHKDDTSGGPPYSIAIPDASADAKVLYEWHDLYFVEYLRESFDCGGFPGLRREGGGLPQRIQELAQGLLPF